MEASSAVPIRLEAPADITQSVNSPATQVEAVHRLRTSRRDRGLKFIRCSRTYFLQAPSSDVTGSSLITDQQRRYEGGAVLLASGVVGNVTILNVLFTRLVNLSIFKSIIHQIKRDCSKLEEFRCSFVAMNLIKIF